MLDGASRLEELVDAAVQDNQKALGITDHGNMYGVLPFYRTCIDKGVKPIIGTEAYMAYESRHERPRRGKGGVDDSGGNTDEGRKSVGWLPANSIISQRLPAHSVSSLAR